MLNPFVSCTIYAIEMMIVYIFLSRIAERRMVSVKCFLLGFILFEAGSCGNLFFQNNVVINVCISILIKTLYAVLCFEVKPLAVACYSVILEVLNFALELVAIFGFSAFVGVGTANLNSNLALVLVSTFVSKSLLLITCLILSNIVNPKARYVKTPIRLFYYPVSVAVCLAIFWYVCVQSGTSFNVQFLLAIASLVIFVSTLILFITYQHQIEADSEHIRLKSEFERLQTEKSYYDILEQQNQNLMIYAHDAKNHLAAIQALNRDPAIDDYLTKLSDQLKSYSKNCHSGNIMLDVMIGKYMLDSERSGVQFDYNVRSCNLKKMDDMDLVAVLGNLMDNAMTAAKGSAEKRITLETTLRNGFEILIISNSSDTTPNICGRNLVTSKTDKKLHGFGLKSVEKILKKYQGGFEWRYDEDRQVFTTTAFVGNTPSV